MGTTQLNTRQRLSWVNDGARWARCVSSRQGAVGGSINCFGVFFQPLQDAFGVGSAPLAAVVSLANFVVHPCWQAHLERNARPLLWWRHVWHNVSPPESVPLLGGGGDGSGSEGSGLGA